MEVFHTGREAKEFLISKIVAEAERENLQLSDLERKMLYFSESDWTVPDMMKVSEDFDRKYDQGDYERTIAKLIARTDRSIRKVSREGYDRWWAAIRCLQQEDHYISVMIRLAGLRPRGDQFSLFVTAIGLVVLFVVSAFWAAEYDIQIPSFWEVMWAILLVSFAAYVLLRFTLGQRRADDLISITLERLVRTWQRVSGSA